MKKLLMCILVLCVSCAALQRMGGAGAGAAVGSIGGPPGAAVGAVVGEAAVELWQGEDAVDDLEDRVENVEEALTTGDVSKIVMNHSDGLMDTIWGWIKAIIGGGLICFLLAIFYTLRRKGAAKHYYDKLEKLWEDSDNE